MTRIAVISVSRAGAMLGATLAEHFGEPVDLYEKRGKESGAEARYFDRTIALTSEIFGSYELLVYIMAMGIVVRAIAPHVQSKVTDPAVVVLDECGYHTISLLSGHLGGANEWTAQIAQWLGSDPVITTATDVHGVTAPDVVARKINARVEPLAGLKPVNGALARGETVRWYVDERMSAATMYRDLLQKMGIETLSWESYRSQPSDVAVVISDRADVTPRGEYVLLRPPTLAVGMGCRRGTSRETLEDTLRQACMQIDRSPLSVAAFGSVDVKKDEEGLLALAAEWRRPITFYSADEMGRIIAEYELEESAFVKQTIGVGNICETAVILMTKQHKMLLNKTKCPQSTIAIGEVRLLSSVSDPGMKKN